MRIVLAACLLFLLAPTGGIAAAQEVTIYRCVGKQGQVALRDSPCLPGETQQTRSMQRPRDPAPGTRPATPSVMPAPPPPAPTERVVYRNPPRAMYECITPEGERYTSDDGEGRPRFVPYWAGGYPYPVWPHPHGGSVSGHIPIGNGGGITFQSGSPTPLPPTPRPPGHPPGNVIVPAGGVWVRDQCHELPQAEVCARLSDRRYEILRRYGSAMPSERRTLDLEQRGIDARIANDCRKP
jgi:hypothetical protein